MLGWSYKPTPLLKIAGGGTWGMTWLVSMLTYIKRHPLPSVADDRSLRNS